MMPQITIPVILRDMKKMRDPHTYPHLKFHNFSSKGAPGIKVVNFTAYADAITGDPLEYKVMVQLHGVVFVDIQGAQIPKGVVAVDMINGKTAYFVPPELRDTPVKLFCACPDWRFRWQYPLYRKRATIGAYRHYVKVPGSNRPPVNPDNILGVCKHQYSLLGMLQSAGMIRGL